MIQNDLEFPEGILEAFLKFGHARQVSGLLAVALGDISVNTIQLIHRFHSQNHVGFHDGASLYQVQFDRLVQGLKPLLRLTIAPRQPICFQWKPDDPRTAGPLKSLAPHHFFTPPLN